MSKLRRWVDAEAELRQITEEQQLFREFFQIRKPTVRYTMDATPRHFQKTPLQAGKSPETKTMKTKKLYRQGDVLIERIAKLPKSAKAIAAKDKVILAHGEVTGHHHFFAAEDATEFDIGGRRHFDVKGKPVRASLPIIRQWNGQVMVDHPTLGKIEFAEQDVEITDGKVFIDGDFAILTHQEHTALGIPAGLYAMPHTDRGVQREYSPEEIRRVAD